MINLISQLTGNGSEPLLSQATEEAPLKGGEKQTAEKTFLNLMSGFLGMNLSQGNKSNHRDLPEAEPNTVNETVLKKAETKVDTDLLNLQESKVNDQSGSGHPFKTEEFLGSTFIHFGKTLPVESNQNQFADIEHDQIIIEHDQIIYDSQVPKNNSIIGNTTLGEGTESTDDLQVRRSGDNIVIDFPESDELSKPGKADGVKRQILDLVDQISKQNGRKLITEIDLNTISRKSESHQDPEPVRLLTAELSKSTSGNVQLILKNVPEITITGEKLQNHVPGNGLNNQTGKATQELPLKDIIQAFSEKGGVPDKKHSTGDSGKIRLSPEKKQSVRLSDLPEKKSTVIKELKPQADRKLQSDPPILKEISGENTKTDKQLAGKNGAQTGKHSSVIQQMEKSPVQPVQTSSNPKTMEGEFKPLVHVTTEISDTEMEIQARADKDTSDNDEGRSFFKSNNANVGHASKNSGRGEFSTQMAKHLQKQAEQAGAGAQKTWSHHRFVLENGEAVNLSVRQSEGVMQLQLSAGNSELNKILQQHINEIREHLQEQMSIDIDLQLQHFGDQPTDNSGHDSGNGKRGQENESEGIWHNSGAEVEVQKKTMRYLGFNNNEWTA